MSLDARKERTKALFNPDHWRLFAEFTKYEMASGGPDQHVALMGALVKDCSLEEKLWRGGCYISAYNVATAEIIWRDWDFQKALRKSMLPWFVEHWSGITTRTERKGVRIKENMVTFFETYIDWICDIINGDKAYLNEYMAPEDCYNLMYEDFISNVKYAGRYVAIKLLEYLKRYCGFAIELEDVRPIGGWSPRTTLSLLFPKRINYFLGDDSKENMKVINESSDEALEILRNTYGLKQADMFTLECVLCNYRQSYVGLKLYPGRTHDTEKRYMEKISPHWENQQFRPTPDFWRARQRIFPKYHLAELNDEWLHRFPDGVRSKDIGVLTKKGFIWSDLVYDYNATVHAGRAFDDPIIRKDAEINVKDAFRLRRQALSC